ncbi:MAG: HAMP domain-containing sensor histidine kinase [Tissierellia bacterium]|nr:HAMP domain-containing sensor histidine kinase [Tissierellia bacterium]
MKQSLNLRGNSFGRFFEILRIQTYLEVIFLGSLFLSTLAASVLIGFTGIGRRHLMGLAPSLFLFSLGITLFFWILKLLRSGPSRTWMWYYLLREFHREGIYLLFLIVNGGIFLIFFLLAVTSVDILLILFTLPFLILMIMGEDVVMQNRILRLGIKETGSYEDLTGFSPMMRISTYESLMDLTRIKDQMYHAAEESLNSEKMKSELITNVTHDLKTPLTSIINYADLLSKKTVMDEEAQSYIQVLGRNSQRMKSLIVDLIEASKANSGNVAWEPVIIDFNELILQIYGDFDHDYQSKGLDFIYRSDEEDVPIYTDPNLLSRVVSNLFSNTYKYAQEQSKVYGKTFITEDKVFFTLKNVSKNALRQSAKDLQDQFIRGDKSRTTEGNGLGLYIARTIVELLGGQFRIVISGDEFQVFVELPKEAREK